MVSCPFMQCYVSFNCKRHNKRNRNIFEKCKTKCVASYFWVVPKNMGLHKSTAHISSSNSKSTNHVSLTGTDNCYCKLSKNSTLEENLRENQRITYISGIVQAFKSKVLIIHAATYIVDCTVSKRL